MSDKLVVRAKKYADLTPDQKKAFDELKAIVKGWDHLKPHQHEWLSDVTLMRFLRARSYKVQKAKAMLVNTLNWRVANKPHQISHTAVYEQGLQLANYYHMTDVHGHPVCYMRFARDPAGFSADEKLKYIMFNLEEGFRIMKRNEEKYPGIERIIYIIDLDKFSMTAPGADTGIARKWGDMLSNHYPESMHKAYLLRYPMIFSIFWSIVSTFMDKVTVSKVNWVNKTGQKLKDYFAKEGFDLDLLEAPMGNVSELSRPNYVGHDDYHPTPMVDASAPKQSSSTKKAA